MSKRWRNKRPKRLSRRSQRMKTGHKAANKTPQRKMFKTSQMSKGQQRNKVSPKSTKMNQLKPKSKLELLQPLTS